MQCYNSTDCVNRSARLITRNVEKTNKIEYNFPAYLKNIQNNDRIVKRIKIS